MTVNAVSSSASAALASLPASADNEQRFLKLLVTQLNNQDPLNPLDNAQLTSQLAQMSTVSGIEKLNTAFQSMLAQSGSGQVLQSAGLIGHSVLVAGQAVAVRKGVAAPFAVELPAGAESVKVSVTNAAGATIRSLDLGALPPGIKTVTWDGLGDNAAAVADGTYSIKVVATTGGVAVSASPLTYQKVVSVAQSSSGVVLELSTGAKAGLADFRQIL